MSDLPRAPQNRADLEAELLGLRTEHDALALRTAESADALRASQDAHAQTEVARQAAEAAGRSKDRFLAMLSHELRTPMSPVLMLATFREHDPAVPAEIREDFAAIRRNVELQLTLIQDLYDVTAIANGKLTLRRERVSAHHLLQTAVEICKSEALKKGLTIIWRLEAESEQLNVDRGRLAQVFWNLMANAVKFTPAGGTITLRTFNHAPPMVSVEVADTGIGMDVDSIERIFNAFDQGAARASGDFGGLGLGLAISKAIVDMHGGEIRAASSGAGGGSTFTVTLPTYLPTAAAGDLADPAAEPVDALRILVVDDHADAANVMARVLRLEGHTIGVANRAADALELAAARPFDIVITDIGLPDRSGHELMRQLREEHGLVGVAVTGYGRDEDLQQSRDSGFAGHLTKPVSLVQLRAMIRQIRPLLGLVREPNGAQHITFVSGRPAPRQASPIALEKM